MWEAVHDDHLRALVVQQVGNFHACVDQTVKLIDSQGGHLLLGFALLGLGRWAHVKGCAARFVDHDYLVSSARVIVSPAERYEKDTCSLMLLSRCLNCASHR